MSRAPREARWIAGAGPACLILVAALVAQSGCAPSVNTLQVTVEAYISAVSLGDVARILALSAPYQRDLAAAATPEEKDAVAKRYRGLIEQGYMLWDQSKSTGELAPGPLGVTLIRATGLGKEGAAAMPLGVRMEADNTRAVVSTRVLTNYGGIHWQSIPTGGRMYLMGYPFGRVVNFATGYDDPSTLDLLATVSVEWTLVRIPDVGRSSGASTDWFVEQVTPLPDTATSWSPPGPDAP